MQIDEPSPIIGFGKRFNHMPAIAEETPFFRFRLAAILPAPSEVARVRAANSGITGNPHQYRAPSIIGGQP